MNGLTDQQLLQEYAHQHSEAAFAELVRRHVDFVYSAALRTVRDPQLAEDVSQGVFAALAEHAATVAGYAVVAGWLHRTARNLAAKGVRSDARRRIREQEAAAMNELLRAEPGPAWETIAPHLDDTMDELNEADRDVLFLRYFQSKSLREVGAALGTSDDAAQKRVSRAIERLRDLFARRGITIGAGGLSAIISANAVQAAPAGLALAVTTAAALSGTTLAAAATATTTQLIMMTTLQKALVAATVIAAVGAGVYEARQASTLRARVETLQQQQAPLVEQVAQLKAANEVLSNDLARARDAQALSRAQMSDLMRLRGNASVVQAESRELARLRSALAQESAKTPDYFTNAMAMGMEMARKRRVKSAQAQVARMTKTLNLTDAQAQAVNDLMQKQIDHEMQLSLDMVSGKLSPEQIQALGAGKLNQDAEVRALLSPEQLAVYPDYQQAEKHLSADASAKAAASQIADDFNLSKEQQEQVRAALYAYRLNETGNTIKAEIVAAAAQKNSSYADALNRAMAADKSELEKRLKLLEGILSPEQIKAYRDDQLKQMDLSIAAAKMFFPQKPAGSTN